MSGTNLAALYQFMWGWMARNSERILTFTDRVPLHISSGVVGKRSLHGGYTDTTLHPAFIAYMKTPKAVRHVNAVLRQMMDKEPKLYQYVLYRMYGLSYRDMGLTNTNGKILGKGTNLTRRVMRWILASFPREQLAKWNLLDKADALQGHVAQKQQHNAAVRNGMRGLRLKEAWRGIVGQERCVIYWPNIRHERFDGAVLWATNDKETFNRLSLGERVRIRKDGRTSVAEAVVTGIAVVPPDRVPRNAILESKGVCTDVNSVVVVTLSEIETYAEPRRSKPLNS